MSAGAAASGQLAAVPEQFAAAPEQLAAARELVAAAGWLVLFTGAGVSAESGIATFREAQTGLWSRFDAQALATEEGFRKDPELVWGWYAHRRRLAQQAQPNAAHLAAAQYEARGGRISVITQNVDGLHRRAGSGDVLELHGSLLRARCVDCATPAHDGWQDDPGARVPCRRCGAPLRPDVVWFGEALSETALQRAGQLARGGELMLVVGTSALVYPAAGLPLAAHEAGVPLIVINPEPTPLDALAQHCLRARAGEALPVLLAELPRR
ncbi:MAG: NAD-dependent deacylase [Burkholderiaceae bacterium]